MSVTFTDITTISRMGVGTQSMIMEPINSFSLSSPLSLARNSEENIDSPSMVCKLSQSHEECDLG